MQGISMWGSSMITFTALVQHLILFLRPIGQYSSGTEETTLERIFQVIGTMPDFVTSFAVDHKKNELQSKDASA